MRKEKGGIRVIRSKKSIQLTLLQFGQVHDALGSLRREKSSVSNENNNKKLFKLKTFSVVLEMKQGEDTLLNVF